MSVVKSARQVVALFSAFIIVQAINNQSVTIADGFRNPPEGAATLGQGGMRVTEATDATAVTHNPANLTDLKDPELMATLTFGYSPKKFTDGQTGQSETSNDPWAFLPAVYAAWPLHLDTEKPWVAGVGVNVPFGQASKWDENGVFAGRAPYYASMRSVNVNPSLAMQLHERLSLGIGLDAMWSDLEFRQTMPWMVGVPGISSSRLVFQGDGEAFGANAGLTWKVTDSQRIGLTYRSPMTVKYEGDFTIENPPPPGFLPPGTSNSSDFDTEINFPAVAMLGYGIHVTKTVRVEANLEWCQDSRNESMDIDIAENQVLLGGNSSLRQDWKDTWSYGIGADWDVAEAWTLRAGWNYLQSPVPDDTVMSTLAENDKHTFAVGVGYHKNGQSIDLAYAYSIMKDRTVSVADNPMLNGTYEFDPHLVALSYICRF